MTTPTPTTGGSATALRRVVLYATLVALALIFLTPLVWMVITSLKTYTAAQQIPPTLAAEPARTLRLRADPRQHGEPGAALVPQQHAGRHAARRCWCW